MTDPNPAVSGTDEGLIRAIGTGALGANVVNMVVGAGIFVYPGIMAAMLGPAAIFAYLACSAIVSLVFLCFAEVGSRVNRSGGAYAYISEAFGPFAGFLASILFWFGWSVFGDAAIAVAMTDALSTVVPELAKPVPRAGFLVALFTFLALINLFGVKSGMRLFLFNTVAKLVPLLLLVAAGAVRDQFRQPGDYRVAHGGRIRGCNTFAFLRICRGGIRAFAERRDQAAFENHSAWPVPGNWWRADSLHRHTNGRSRGSGSRAGREYRDATHRYRDLGVRPLGRRAAVVRVDHLGFWHAQQ